MTPWIPNWEGGQKCEECGKIRQVLSDATHLPGCKFVDTTDQFHNSEGI